MISYRELLRRTPDINKLSITLKEHPSKGVSMIATKTIQKGETIAYYMIKVYREKDYESPTDFVYSFEVYRKNGEAYKRLIGDITKDCFPDPQGGIPYWGAFANEPSQGQRSNSEISLDLGKNFKDRRFLSPGDTVIYRLVATKRIRKGDEIMWYYGERYSRNYKVGKH